jgi:transketolase
MRLTFIKKLIEKADENTYLMVGDVGYSVIEPYIEKFPQQYLNTGVAEQNMTGMAAGMAMEGHKVFTYSIANFNTVRCLEQIRNDICYHNLDVTVVSVGGGFVYGSAGYSHHAIQDISMLGGLANMTLLLPADANETSYCMDYIFKTNGPKYLRLGKNGEKTFYTENISIDNINCLNPEEISSIALVSVGTILSVSFEVQELLRKSGISVKIYSCPVIDKNFSINIKEKLKDFKYVFTIEEHIKDFGFGSLVKNSFEDIDIKVKSFGAKRDLCKMVGSQSFLREKHGLTGENIAKEIEKDI